ncbi:MAG: helix-turn-helix domain-containing protein [Oscillospiraceae bacterium]
MQKAKKLLLSTKKSVLDIAYEAGFSTGKFFTIVFKQIEGISPKEYRKKNLKKKS